MSLAGLRNSTSVAFDTPGQLWLFIAERFGIRLPHRPITPGHSTPFGFVWDAYSNPGQDMAVWANRSGLKTLCASILAAVEYATGEHQIHGRVLSGSEDQARNLYNYWQSWCNGVLADRITGDPGRMLTTLDNGTFEILAASQKRVRGGKVQRLYRDEIDEIDPDVYAASVGMLDSRGGLQARTIDTSTWHRANGPMGKLIEEASSRGIRVHRWNVWESLAQCPRERHQDGLGCKTCPLAGPCIEKARQSDPGSIVGVAARCAGLMAIDDAIKQLRQWSKQQWEAEAECKRPSLSGLVYPQFDPGVHVCPDLDFQDALPIYRAIDWGLNTFVCLWLQMDKRGAVYVVDEYWSQDATLATNATAIKARDKATDGQGVPVEATYCDPAGRNRNDQTGYSDVQVFRSLGIPCRYAMSAWAREVANGVNLIRGMLQPAAGAPRLFVAGQCKQMIKAFLSYRLRKVNGEFIDEPLKPQEMDHGCFPPGQPVYTPTGMVPVEQVRVGDCLLSHDGLCHVEHVQRRDVAQIVKVTLDDGREIRCTPDHPLAVHGGGWIPAGQAAGACVDVMESPGSPAASMTNRGDAHSVAQHSLSTAMSRRNAARVGVRAARVLRVEPAGSNTVYNLATTSGTFIVNGLLVSNCDALRYAIVNLCTPQRASMGRLGYA